MSLLFIPAYKEIILIHFQNSILVHRLSINSDSFQSLKQLILETRFMFFESLFKLGQRCLALGLMRLGKNSIWGENSVNLFMVNRILSRVCTPDRMSFYHFKAFLPSIYICKLKAVFWTDLVSLIWNLKAGLWVVSG